MAVAGQLFKWPHSVTEPEAQNCLSQDIFLLLDLGTCLQQPEMPFITALGREAPLAFLCIVMPANATCEDMSTCDKLAAGIAVLTAGLSSQPKHSPVSYVSQNQPWSQSI